MNSLKFSSDLSANSLVTIRCIIDGEKLEEFEVSSDITDQELKQRIYEERFQPLEEECKPSNEQIDKLLTINHIEKLCVVRASGPKAGVFRKPTADIQSLDAKSTESNEDPNTIKRFMIFKEKKGEFKMMDIKELETYEISDSLEIVEKIDVINGELVIEFRKYNLPFWLFETPIISIFSDKKIKINGATVINGIRDKYHSNSSKLRDERNSLLKCAADINHIARSEESDVNINDSVVQQLLHLYDPLLDEEEDGTWPKEGQITSSEEKTCNVSLFTAPLAFVTGWKQWLLDSFDHIKHWGLVFEFKDRALKPILIELTYNENGEILPNWKNLKKNGKYVNYYSIGEIMTSPKKLCDAGRNLDMVGTQYRLAENNCQVFVMNFLETLCPEIPKEVWESKVDEKNLKLLKDDDGYFGKKATKIENNPAKREALLNQM